MTGPNRGYYAAGPRQVSNNSFLGRWWPALVGNAVLLAIIGVLGYAYLRGPQTEVEIISAVPMIANITDVDGDSGATGTVELEFNNGTGEVCHRVAATSLSNPFTLTLNSASGVVLDMGTHTTGTIGCTDWIQASAQAVLSRPETHYAELHSGDGVVMRGALEWNSDAGSLVDGAPSDADDGSVVAQPGDGTLKAGFILPDTESSSRWEEFDRPLILAACQQAGIECMVENALGDPAQMATIAENMIAQGIGVLAIAAIDSESGAAIQQQAAAAGVKNIDYDRLTLGGAADVYVSFDNVSVGAEEANGLIECLAGDTAGKRIIILHGSPTDNNAALVKQGYTPVVEEAGFDVVGEADVPDWNAAEARVLFEELFEAAGGDIDGVLVANDGMSLAAQSVLQENDLQIPTTGQDAQVDALRALLTGDQCVTVYKPIAVEADSVVDAAVALLRGTDPPANSTIADGDREIPFVQAAVTPVFKGQVAVPIQDGFVSREAVCEGIEDLCQEAGIG